MTKFFHNTLRVPHIQNATERVRATQLWPVKQISVAKTQSRGFRTQSSSEEQPFQFHGGANRTDAQAKEEDSFKPATANPFESHGADIYSADISAAATAVVSSTASLAVFLFGFFLIHNLEGAVTVNDIYNASSVNERRGRGGDNSSTSNTSSPRGDHQLQVEHTIIVLNQIREAGRAASRHDMSHFQVSRTNTREPEVPVDSKDIHMSLPE
ncbi:hypothetical protein EGW08_005800 [Elysia chlorotica]|uniref:Uncharacterized protein n=1 Tax=Elysia chlorotica TaxID=188477 RepID=A0A3S1HUL4_ELYCH|nr:hypothetical protein EGW08_005800 [Elysia chlorotica]